MKLVKTIFFYLVLLIFCPSCQKIEKPYLTLLSYQIPTDTPLIFGEGIISIKGHISGSITFSPDMKEIFFNRRKSDESHNIYTMKFVDGKWSEPKPAFFSTNKKYLDFHSRYSPKGDRLYFGSTRPLSYSTKSSGLHQWYIEKNENGWGEPIPLIEKPFEDRFIMCTTPSANGNLYFTSKEKGQKLEDEGTYYAINQEGNYTITKMSNEINAPGKWIAHPYVAPDESYIIYDAERTSEYENGDLYISFNKNGTWTKSYSLGSKINTKIGENAATVSPDGQYLFFNRGEEKTREDGSKYWVNALYWVDFIQLKNEILQNINNS